MYKDSRSRSITPSIEVEAQLQELNASLLQLKELYVNNLKATNQELAKIKNMMDKLEQDKSSMWSFDMLQTITMDDKRYRGLTEKAFTESKQILETLQNTRLQQKTFVEKCLNDWKFFTDKYTAPEREEPCFIFKNPCTIPDSDITVTRYGINVCSALCIEEYNAIIRECFSSELLSADAASDSKKSSKKEADRANECNKKLLHPVEVFILQNALITLQNTAVVLLDIFEREQNGTISIQDNKVAKTHTIVLCRKGQEQFELVDPSNSEFSSHLVSDFNRKFIASEINIVVHKKNIKLYSPASRDNVGPQYHQFRDCIDIAIKIAFVVLINADVFSEHSSVYEIKQIQELSNQQDVDPMYPEFPKDTQYPLRVKQSSAFSDRKECNEMLDKINSNLSEIRKFGLKNIDLTWENMGELRDHAQTLIWLQEQGQNISKFVEHLEKQNEELIKPLGLMMRLSL